MRVLVCGGRHYKNLAAVEHALTVLHAKRCITVLIEGGATGADCLARRWAEKHGITVMTFPADWKKFGRQAGPWRNNAMLYQGKPDGVVAFPGGAGTANMISQAEAAGVKVWRTGGWPSNPGSCGGGG